MMHELRSGFAGRIKNMLEHRALMGRHTADYQKYLENFDRFCLKNYADESVLTQEIALSWCNEAINFSAVKRACIMRNFGRFLALSDENAYILPQMSYPSHRANPPYIFTDDELKNFFSATDRCSPKRNPLLQYTVPVIFRLQYACGMRPQEVRKLRCIDFNFADQTIYIAEGKHNKDRKLGVNSEIMELCMKYDQIANSVTPERTFFFQAPSGEAYSSLWLSTNFHKCWEMGGNSNERGICVPYDLRHNYASRVLMRWLEEGKDLNTWVPYLSAYLGHESFKATFYYIHMLPERLALMNFVRLDGILPEVCCENA
jgi:integrase